MCFKVLLKRFGTWGIQKLIGVLPQASPPTERDSLENFHSFVAFTCPLNDSVSVLQCFC